MNMPDVRLESSPCLACGEGILSTHKDNNELDIHGKKVSVPLLYSVCDHCGAELTNAAQAQTNKRAMLAAEKHAFGLLAGEQIRAFRQRYHLSQQQAALLFGGGKVGFSRYENDDIVQSQAMDSLLRLCIDHPTSLVRLARLRQIELPTQAVHDIQAAMHQQLVAMAPMVQQQLDAAMASERKARAPAASNDSQRDKFPVNERIVWRLAA